MNISAFEEEFLRIHKKLLPAVEISGTGSVSQDGELQSASIRLLHHNRVLVGSPYEYKGVSRFIHYTASPQRIVDAIHEGSIRVNSLRYFNDPQEFEFILRGVDRNAIFPKGADLNRLAEIIEWWKDHIHAWSFCEYPEGKEESFGMWRMYGAEGNGAAIVFEIDHENINSWNGFYLGRVHYGRDSHAYRHLKEFMNDLAVFWTKHEGSYYDQFKHFQSVIKSIFAFHKQSIWQLEDEVRLVVSTDDTANGVMKRPTLSHQMKKTSQVELELVTELPPKFDGAAYPDGMPASIVEAFLRAERYRSHPRVRIKEIILGYAHSEDTCKEFFDAIQDAKHAKGMPLFIVRHSKLREYFR